MMDFLNKKTFCVTQLNASILLYFLFSCFLYSSSFAQISYRAASTSTTVVSSTVIINKPSGTVSGDVMIVNISTNGNNTKPSCLGWTLVSSQSSLGGSNNRHAAILYKIATNIEPSSYTFALGSGASGVAGGILSFSGVDTSGGTPFDVVGSFGTGNDKVPTAPAISTTIANDVVVMFTQIAGGTAAFSSWSTTSPGTLTELYDVNGSNTQVAAGWSLKSSIGSTGVGTNSIPNNRTWGAILLALKPCMPTVTTQPDSLIALCVGGSLSLSAVISGAVSYQWKKNGVDITGATSSNYTLNNLSVTDSGKYSLTGTSICGTTVATDTSVVSISTMPSVTISSDYCAVAGKVRLTAVPSPAGVYSYSWSNGSNKDTTSVDLAGTYTVTITNSSGCSATATLPVSIELAVNGDFEQGNIGFTTPFLGTQHYQYVVDTPAYQRELYPEGLYAVDTNANNFHNNFWGHDHTSGRGKFMIVNGFPGVQPIVWQETINVTPNTTYYFSAWAMSLNSAGNYASLKFSINGVQVGTTAVLTAHGTSSASTDNWTRFYATWNSGTATTATCSIVDLQTATGGNDFGLDDISISTLSPFVSLTSDSATSEQTICQNSPITNISLVIGSGGSPVVTGLPNGLTYSYNGYNLIISGTPTNTGTYNFTVSTSGCSVFTFNGRLNVNGVTWLGGLNQNWENAANWCGGVPTFSTNVTIPAGVPNYPIVNNSASVKDININSGASLTINLNGTISVKGDFNNNGTVVNNGEIEFEGNADQTFPGTGNFSNIYELLVNKSGGSLILNNSISVAKQLTLENGILNLSDFDITLKSNETNTASIAPIPNSANIIYGSGRFVVERYIPTGTGIGQHGKSWQFLSVPVKGSQTVKQAWQENAAFPNQNNANGYGIQITSNLSNALSLGFDVKTSTPSMKTYDAATNTFVGIPNTNSYPIQNSLGYMVFIRGNRNDTSYLQAAEPTTLRSRGTIFLRGSDAPPVTTVASGKYQSVGNPFTSAIDFSNTTGVQFDRSAIDNAFYVWDPTLTGSYNLGGYQTISAANNWRPIPGTTFNYASGVANPKIQSGQAFFMHATGAGGSVTFSEDAKVSGSSIVMRGTSNDSSISNKQFFETKLLAVVNGASRIADGVVAVAGQDFANLSADAPKILNSGENFSINKNGSLYAIVTKNRFCDDDTLYYSFNNLKTATYQLVFIPENFSNQHLTAFLIDRFLQTSTELSLTDTSVINFSYSNTHPSDRFFVVFKAGAILPISDLKFSARRLHEHSGVIEWNNDMSNKKYYLERSTDGKYFTQIYESADNDKSKAKYIFIDSLDRNINYYYRLKIKNSNNAIEYTKIIMIAAMPDKSDVFVFPNPVVGNVANVIFSDNLTGIVTINLMDHNGKLIETSCQKITNGKISFKYSSHIPSGSYVLNIVCLNGFSFNKTVVLYP